MRTNITYSLLAALAFTWLTFPSTTRAVSPPPDGGYPNFNTAEGTNALANLNVSVAQGNTAVGDNALVALTNTNYNTAVGVSALNSSTSGADNTAIGAFALEHSDGSSNTGIGFGALFINRSGSDNTAVGATALNNNASGSNNTATGAAALANSTTASENTATGFNALRSDTTGPVNTATGAYALYSNTTGQSNVATGYDSLYHNKIGHDNTGNGYLALLNSTGSNNTALGSNAGLSLTTGSNNIDIGANVLGNAGEANTIRVGKHGTQKATFVAGIRGVAVASGVGVIVGTTGQLGTVVSSARFKEAIKPMDKSSEAILALKPVTFRYKEELDPDKIPQFGLVAEEVEKVNPDLVVKDEVGKVSAVRYEAVNAMLLNEFLKEHHKVEEQGVTIAQMKKQIDALTASVQKVSERPELNKPSSH